MTETISSIRSLVFPLSGLVEEKMRPLRIALVHRDSDRCTDKRMVGIWSYPVPEFEWDHYPVNKGFQLNRAEFSEYDFIFYEDGKLFGRFTDGVDTPVLYYVVDSTLSDEHYKLRREQAAQCDLVLVDHDELQRFRWRDGPPVRRLSHCVNDKWFRDYGMEKDVDVSFHCRTKGSPERESLEQWLAEFCRKENYRYASGTRFNEEYARSFNRSKITVNLGRTPTNRPHRVFDALACRVCLLTSPLPQVEPLELSCGTRYVEWKDREELAGAIHGLLRSGNWEDFADNGYEMIHRWHTWSVRAKELRQIVREELRL